jgi:hypothetical protein
MISADLLRERVSRLPADGDLLERLEEWIQRTTRDLRGGRV